MAGYSYLIGEPVHVRQPVVLSNGTKQFHFNGILLAEDDTHITLQDVKQGEKKIPKFGIEIEHLPMYKWNLIIAKHSNTIESHLDSKNADKAFNIVEWLKNLDAKINKLEKERDKRFDDKLAKIGIK